MDDGALLLDAILAEPAEDMPRLAYADWLDEHAAGARVKCPRCNGTGNEDVQGIPDDPLLCRQCNGLNFGTVIDTSIPDRAEFIRGQIAMANWRPYVPPAEILEIAASDRLYATMAAIALDEQAAKHVDRLKFLQDRTAELLARHEFAWAAPMGDIGWQANSTWVPDCEWQFRRGFVSHVGISCLNFVTHAAAIFAAHPVTQVLTDAAPDHYDRGGLDFGWHIGTAGLDVNPGDGVLPAVLFDAIVPHPTDTVATNVLKVYPTPELALEALTDGLLKFGRAGGRAKRAAAILS